MNRGEEVFRDNPAGLREKLAGSSVGIAGCGGIGSNVALMLARAGVGRLVLIDFDRVEERNLNRQCYFAEHIGMRKVEALRREILGIEAGTVVETREDLIDSANAVSLFTGCDLLVEALDLDESKEMLLNAWLSALPDTPVVACSGLAGMGDPSSVTIDRRRNLVMIGDGASQLSLGTLSARVCLVASMMALEAVRILTGAVSRCESCPDKCSGEVELRSDGIGVPLTGFPARALEGALRGLLSAYRGVDPDSCISITLGRPKNH